MYKACGMWPQKSLKVGSLIQVGGESMTGFAGQRRTTSILQMSISQLCGTFHSLAKKLGASWCYCQCSYAGRPKFWILTQLTEEPPDVCLV